MKRLIVDRFEGKYVIFMTSDKNFFAITATELPSTVQTGDVVDILDNGEILVNTEETQKRKEYKNGKQIR